MNQAALVDLAQGAGDADRQRQKAADLHRRADERRERLAARILQHQDVPAMFVHEFRRPDRPRAVQIVFQFVVTGEAGEDRGRRAFAGRRQDEHGALLAIGARSPSSTQDPLAVVPQDVHALIHRR